MTKFQNQLEGIEKHIQEQTVLKKETMKLSEAALYLGISKSFLYKLTSKRSIPFYRPGNKLIFFRRIDLDAWIQQNKSIVHKSILHIKTTINDKN